MRPFAFVGSMPDHSVAAVLNIPCITTLSGASAMARALEAYRDESIDVKALQDYLVEVEQAES